MSIATLSRLRLPHLSSRSFLHLSPLSALHTRSLSLSSSSISLTISTSPLSYLHPQSDPPPNTPNTQTFPLPPTPNSTLPQTPINSLGRQTRKNNNSPHLLSNPNQLPIKGVYAARQIDVVKVYQTVFGSNSGVTHRFGKESVIVELPVDYGNINGNGVINGASSAISSSATTINNGADEEEHKRQLVDLVQLTLESTNLENFDFEIKLQIMNYLEENRTSFNTPHKKKAFAEHIDNEEKLIKSDSLHPTPKTVKVLQALDTIKDLAKAYDSSSTSSSPPQLHEMTTAATPQSAYLVVFKYGSIVFFNVPLQTQQTLLSAIKSHSISPIVDGQEHTDGYSLIVNPNLKEPSYMESDHAVLKRLDVNNVAVISTVMGQTVALDYYSQVVDSMLDTFTQLNGTVEVTGTFSAMERKSLFMVVAQNNSVFIGLVSKLGLLERSDTAWNYSEYGTVWDGMRLEFELDERFKNLEFKLNLIQHNTRFFIEILNNQKSSNLEWCLIVLIFFESCLMILDMSGLGSVIFGVKGVSFMGMSLGVDSVVGSVGSSDGGGVGGGEMSGGGGGVEMSGVDSGDGEKRLR